MKKKTRKKTCDISSIKRGAKKFLEVSRCGLAKQRQRNVQKKVCCTCKVAFLLIRPNVEAGGGDDVEKVGRTSEKILTTHLLKPETEQKES